jgi:hypothetical protein
MKGTTQIHDLIGLPVLAHSGCLYKRKTSICQVLFVFLLEDETIELLLRDLRFISTSIPLLLGGQRIMIGCGTERMQLKP